MDFNSKENKFVTGVDIGGSHITVGLVDIDQRTLIKNTLTRKSVNADGTLEEIFETWCKAIEQVQKLNPENIKRIGIAMPGPFDYAQGISWMHNMNKFENLYGINIKQKLSQKLNLQPDHIFFRNDAEAFLAGEVMCGAARGYNNAIGITIGTGLGTAVHINGKTINVEMGVNTPFADGVAEDYISTRWFVKRWYEMSGKKISGVKEFTEIMKEDVRAKKIFEEFKENLEKFLAIFIRKEKQTDIIAIGGNIANALTDCFEEMEKNLQKEFPNIHIRKAALGENAALIGAAFSD